MRLLEEFLISTLSFAGTIFLIWRIWK